MQGRFLQALPFDSVVTGQELLRPAQNLPARWLVNTVLVRVRHAALCPRCACSCSWGQRKLVAGCLLLAWQLTLPRMQCSWLARSTPP